MVTLVTGATGFVGSAVVRKLLDRGESVRVLVRRNANRANIKNLNVSVAVGDVLDRQSLRKSMQSVESLYHVAADYRLWSHNKTEIFNANVTGTGNVLEAAADAGVGKIVYTSSVCTLASFDDGTIADENSVATQEQMLSGYKESKFVAEKVAHAWAHRGLPITIVNPSTPIGPRDVKPTPTGRMIRDAAIGAMPAFVDTGLNFVHVDDVANGHLLAHDKGRLGERYILGGFNISLKSLLTLISTITGRTPPKFELPRKSLYPIAYAAEAIAQFTRCEPLITVNGLRLAKKKMYFSSAKAQRELGYTFGALAPALADAISGFGIPTPGRIPNDENCRENAWLQSQ